MSRPATKASCPPHRPDRHRRRQHDCLARRGPDGLQHGHYDRCYRSDPRPLLLGWLGVGVIRRQRQRGTTDTSGVIAVSHPTYTNLNIVNCPGAAASPIQVVTSNEATPSIEIPGAILGATPKFIILDGVDTGGSWHQDGGLWEDGAIANQRRGWMMAQASNHVGESHYVMMEPLINMNFSENNGTPDRFMWASANDPVGLMKYEFSSSDDFDHVSLNSIQWRFNFNTTALVGTTIPSIPSSIWHLHSIGNNWMATECGYGVRTP